MFKVYSNLVDDDPKSIRMFYPAFRLNNFTMRAIDDETPTEYSVEFLLPSRILRVSVSDGFALYPSTYYYDLHDDDDSWAIYGNLMEAFDNYDLDRVYEIAKTLVGKIIFEREREIEAK